MHLHILMYIIVETTCISPLDLCSRINILLGGSICFISTEVGQMAEEYLHTTAYKYRISLDTIQLLSECSRLTAVM